MLLLRCCRFDQTAKVTYKKITKNVFEKLLLKVLLLGMTIYGLWFATY